MVPGIVGHTDEVGDVLVDVIALHMQVLDLSAGSFRLLGIRVFRSKLFQELIPGVLVVRGCWVVGPYSHAVFPVANLFSRDERQCQVDSDNE